MILRLKHFFMLVLCGILCCMSVNAQNEKKSISGVVIDNNKEPVIGASIIVKNTSVGTITDLDGRFILDVPLQGVLVFSYIGYKTQEMPISDKSEYMVTLSEDALGLEEVVVVGYGTMKKRDLTGSMSSVRSEQIQATPASNMAEALQGRAAGVLVSTDNWSPGKAPTVLIRGKRSVKASNDPLYVVDGIPITGGMTEINPTDIESMDVLKDASATAIYGARGANGVILITTKTGKAGKTKIDYNGYVGFQTILNQVDHMNGGEYAEYVREAYRNTSRDELRYISPTPNREEDTNNSRFKQSAYMLESVLMGYDENGNYDPKRVRGFDWMDAITRNPLTTDHQLSIRGGGEKTTFLTSVTYTKNDGVVKNEGYERYSIRLNLNHELTKWAKIGLQTQYSSSVTDLGTETVTRAWRVAPIGEFYNQEGNVTMIPNADTQYNPLLDFQKGVAENKDKNNRYLGSYFLEIALPVEGLRFRSNFGIDSRTFTNQAFYAKNTTNRGDGTSYARYDVQKYNMFTLENLLYYNRTFGKHSLGATLLQSIQKDKKETFKTEVEDIPGDNLKYNDLKSALIQRGAESSLSEWTMASFMGRINYTLMDKYMLTVSARYDGSSRLAKGHKWVLFPSAALAWRINEEKFMSGIEQIDNLKLRIGYGMTGNSSVDPYQTLGNLKLVQYVFDNGRQEALGYAPETMQNDILTWEKTSQWNLGLDFGFFNNRISGSVEFYLQKTKDLLLPRQLPIVSGFPELLSNVGETQNKGIEVNIITNNIQTKDFTWSTNFTLFHNKEEIVSLYNGKVDDIGSKWFIGKPVNAHYDYRKIGIWQNTPEDLAEIEKFNANGSTFAPGTIKIKDVDGDYKITDKDREILGSERPKVILSMVNDITYKNFDFSAFLYASFGSVLFNNLQAIEQAGRVNGVSVNYWTPNNPTNEYPRPSIDFERPLYSDAMCYEKADFLRVKALTLGYTLPKSVGKDVFERIRFYVTAQNPFLFTDYSGVDPEGAKGFTTPSVRSWIFGVNLSL